MPVRTWIHSSQLQFTRDGSRLVVAESDRVTFIELRGDNRRRIAIAGVQALAAFSDQVWVATRAGCVTRFAIDGRQLDEHALPVDPDGTLIPTTIGSAAAVWTGRAPVMLVDDLGSLVATPGECHATIPIVGRRTARFSGSRLTLPAGTVVPLANAAQIVGGGVVFDGTSLALVTEHPRGREIAVVGLASGRRHQTVGLAPGALRLAARRGLAVIHEGSRRFAVVDLRFARHLGVMVTDEDAADFAVDPDGRLLAIRLGCGDFELAPLGEHMASVRVSTSLRDPGEHDVDPLRLAATPSLALVTPAGQQAEAPPPSCRGNRHRTAPDRRGPFHPTRRPPGMRRPQSGHSAPRIGRSSMRSIHGWLASGWRGPTRWSSSIASSAWSACGRCERSRARGTPDGSAMATRGCIHTSTRSRHWSAKILASQPITSRLLATRSPSTRRRSLQIPAIVARRPHSPSWAMSLACRGPQETSCS